MRSPVKHVSTATAGVLIGVVVGASAAFMSPSATAWVGDTAVGKAVAVAKYAKNADKVDGKHAVGASTPVSKRKGKLVATDGAGKLPNDIIRKAPDADRLDGVDGSAYRFIQLDLGAGIPVGDTVSYYRTGAFGGGGVNMPDNSGNRVGWGLVLPPSFPSGATLKIRVLWHIDQTGCTVSLLPNSATHERPGLVVDNGNAVSGLDGGVNSFAVPSVAETTVKTDFTAVPTRAGTKFRAFDSYSFSFYRPTSDTCTSPVVITGVSVTY